MEAEPAPAAPPAVQQPDAAPAPQPPVEQPAQPQPEPAPQQPAAQQPPPPQPEQAPPTANGLDKRRRVLLRLDDGSLVGSAETLLGTSHGGDDAIRLDYEAACRTGRAGKRELERLEKLISAFQNKVSGIHAFSRSDLKGRNPYTQDVARTIKRQRSLAGEPIMMASPDQGAAPPVLQSQQSLPSDFAAKAWDVLHRVYATCSQMPLVFNLPAKDVFYKPVSDTFPSIAEDYYRRIPHPMTFETIERRLNSSHYSAAHQFADDVRLVFDNCKRYNPMATDPVRVACLRLSEVFEDTWLRSGLCSDASRSKRTNAGVAAPKFEPEDFDNQALLAAGQPPRPARSHRSGEPRRSSAADGMNRLASHAEVSSYREEEVEQHEIPEDVLNEVANALPELPADHLQAVLAHFNEGVVSHDEEGEVELDLERVDYASLMKVDAVLRELNGLPPRPAPQRAAHNAGAGASSAPGLPGGGGSFGTASQGAEGRPGVRAEQGEDEDPFFDDDDSDDD